MDYFIENFFAEQKFINFCKNHDFNIDRYSTTAATSTRITRAINFMVLTGKNGIGKSRLLELIRGYIVTNLNENFPKKIVRRLDYGEHDDEYDPDKTEHPLFTLNALESSNCNYEKWKTLIAKNKNDILKEKVKRKNKEKEYIEIFCWYYSVSNIETINNIQTIYGILESDHEKKVYFDEFKKYYRRQMLKKICYGSLKQLLMLNMRYQIDLDEINTKIRELIEKYGFEFPYTIEKITKGFVDKSDVNDRILFIKSNNIRVKFKDLSPGERLILHLILLIKDKEYIKIKNTHETIEQVLLLDEPDSHCEANLANIFIDIIKNELVEEMKIKVLMTTHNYITICKIDKENIFLIQPNDDDNLEIKADPEKSLSYDILAKNIIDLFNLNEQPIEVVDKAYSSICFDKNGSIISGKMYGNLLEDFIKKLFKNEKVSLIKKMIGKNFDEKNNIIFEAGRKNNLTDYNLNNLNEEGLHIIWPKSETNYAWDLMFFDKSRDTIHLFQIKNTNKEVEFIKTIGKHLYIIIHILKNLLHNEILNENPERNFYDELNKYLESKKDPKSKNECKEYKIINQHLLNKIEIMPQKHDFTSVKDFKLYFVSSLEKLSDEFEKILENECKLRFITLDYLKKEIESNDNHKLKHLDRIKCLEIFLNNDAFKKSYDTILQTKLKKDSNFLEKNLNF